MMPFWIALRRFHAITRSLPITVSSPTLIYDLEKNNEVVFEIGDPPIVGSTQVVKLWLLAVLERKTIKNCVEW